MASFGLTKNTMLRLQAKFQEFQQARQTIRANIQAYIDDYQKFTGKPSDRQNTLEKEYLPRSPQMGWLIFKDGSRENILWQENDIAALIGRSQASISRVLQRMARSPVWCSRLLALSEETKSANNVPITAYHEEIFDLILDKYEEEYLQKFIKPRRGTPQNSEAVLRFWQYLKDSAQIDEIQTGFQENFSVIRFQKLGARDISSLVFSKILTRKTGLLFTVMFALSFELARRWPGAMPVIFAVSLWILSACAVLLHLRKFRAGLLADVGAVAALMSVFWGLGLLSGGRVYTPAGGTLTLKEEHVLSLEPELNTGHKLAFRVVCDSYGELKEIFYRTDSKQEYISTGFNGYNYPDLLIEPETQDDRINLDVKYTDKDGQEHGPFGFSYDTEKLRFNLSKKAILRGKWLYVSRIAGTASVNIYINNREADDVADSVVYGINTDKPDISRRVRPGSSVIAKMRNNSLDFVSAYLVFADGTSSDIMRAK